jgi:hypothetical protein
VPLCQCDGCSAVRYTPLQRQRIINNLQCTYSLQLRDSNPEISAFLSTETVRKTVLDVLQRLAVPPKLPAQLSAVPYPIPNSQTSTPSSNFQLAKQLMNAIKMEMALFAMQHWQAGHLHADNLATRTCQPCRQNLYSLETEGAFSAAVIFNTKLRSRFKYMSTDTLCFLRAFYARKRLRQQ